MDKERLRRHFEQDGGEQSHGVDFDRFYAMMTEMAKNEEATVTQRICTSGMFEHLNYRWPKQKVKGP